MESQSKEQLHWKMNKIQQGVTEMTWIYTIEDEPDQTKVKKKAEELVKFMFRKTAA